MSYSTAIMPANVIKALSEVITELTDSSELFSAFDVTSKIRNEKCIPVKHHEIRDAITDLYRNGQFPAEYTRSVYNATIFNTVVYHPDTVSVNDYDVNRHTKAASNAVITSNSSSNKVIAGDKTIYEQVVYYGSRGRLCIPASYCKQIGATVGDYVDVRVTKLKITISNSNSTPAPANAFIYMYCVDKSGNIRLSKNVLNKARFTRNTVRLVKCDGLEITIT